ncbi:rCG30951, partial [Rattus norvegicus]
MKALPGGHPRRAIPEVDHGACRVQVLVPTVENGFGVCVSPETLTQKANTQIVRLLSPASMAFPIIVCPGLDCKSLFP